MKTTHSVEATIGNLNVRLTCTLSQLGKVRQLTGKNLLVGESILAGIHDANLAEVIEAFSDPKVLAKDVRDNITDVADMAAAITAISDVLNAPSPTKNPSQAE